MTETAVISNDQITASKAKVDRLIENIGKIIRGKDVEIQKILTCLIAGGHVLLEDLPGQGKNRDGQGAGLFHQRTAYRRCRRTKRKSR